MGSMLKIAMVLSAFGLCACSATKVASDAGRLPSSGDAANIVISCGGTTFYKKSNERAGNDVEVEKLSSETYRMALNSVLSGVRDPNGDSNPTYVDHINCRRDTQQTIICKSIAPNSDRSDPGARYQLSFSPGQNGSYSVLGMRYFPDSTSFQQIDWTGSCNVQDSF